MSIFSIELEADGRQKSQYKETANLIHQNQRYSQVLTP